jgi:tetratricopeptide (TPR) repeat protein
VERIRRLFAVVDSNRFSRVPGEHAEVLSDRAQSESLLGFMLGQLRAWARNRSHQRSGLPSARRSVPGSSRSAPVETAALALIISLSSAVPASAQVDPFQAGVAAYAAEDFGQAAEVFTQYVSTKPSSGAFHNLGNAAWQLGDPGTAILAWERAVWLNPYQKISRDNLLFARKSAQLDAPALTWFEACSSWLPVNAWAWIATASFWIATSLLLLPSALRWPRKYWHQAGAAIGLAVFLVSVPALAGVHSRAHRGVVVTDKTPVRLTPTENGEVLTRLPAGTTARMIRKDKGLFYIRTSAGTSGWIDGNNFHLVAE